LGLGLEAPCRAPPGDHAPLAAQSPCVSRLMVMGTCKAHARQMSPTDDGHAALAAHHLPLTT